MGALEPHKPRPVAGYAKPLAVLAPGLGVGMRIVPLRDLTDVAHDARLADWCAEIRARRLGDNDVGRLDRHVTVDAVHDDGVAQSFGFSAAYPLVALQALGGI